MPHSNTQIMVVAGEASGDLHAAKLVKALRAASPNSEFEFFGAAGPKMRDSGVESIVRSDELSIVGLLEIAQALPMFLGAFRKLKEAAKCRQPDVAILLDFPDFNLKLAKALKKQGIKVVYYISPQLWAWRSYRINAVKKYVDLMITILPFEADWYRARGFEKVEYVGSPLATEVYSDVSKNEFCQTYDLDPTRPIVALLPGSRSKEITRIFPVMLEASEILEQSRSDIQFVVAAADTASAGRIKDIAGEYWKIIVGSTYGALSACDGAAVASGTATLEAAILGAPMVIVYKTSALNYALLRPLISVAHFGLVNLIAGERVAREMIQQEFTSEALADELLRILKPDVNAQVREKLRLTTDKLGHGGASKRAAEAILTLLER
jgi:lipid-A-disaccharide synthase